MTHLFLLYAEADHEFAYQLSVQLQQRGLVIWPVSDVSMLTPDTASDTVDGFAEASHIVGVVSPEALDSEAFRQRCIDALESKKHVIALIHKPADLPPDLQKCPVVDFDEPFLLAVENLVKRLKSLKVPIQTLAPEREPPLSKPGLLPNALPAERCWRDDRLRINYHLPIILTREEMETRIPQFFAQARFEMTKCTKKEIRGMRMREFGLFDPRRAHQTITIQPRKGDLRVYYRMTRVQVYHWYPAHYHVLNREAAALYRYLVTNTLTPAVLEPVHHQALRARLASWGSIIGALLLIVIILLILL